MVEALTLDKNSVLANLVLLSKLNKRLTTCLPQRSVVSSIVKQMILLTISFFNF